MIRQPRKSRYKKAQKGKIYSIYTKRNLERINEKLKEKKDINNKRTKLVACESRRLSGKQIEAARIALNRKIRKNIRKGKKRFYKISVFPNVPISKKPNEVRMGQGKGPIVRWVVRIKPLMNIFELPLKVGKYTRLKRLKAASKKLPFKTLIMG